MNNVVFDDFIWFLVVQSVFHYVVEESGKNMGMITATLRYAISLSKSRNGLACISVTAAAVTK